MQQINFVEWNMLSGNFF